MEIKKMRGRYVRIAPEYIITETKEYVDYECSTYGRDDETDEEWETFCNQWGNMPYKEEETSVTFSNCFSNPYETFKVDYEFFGIDVFGINSIKTEEPSHQVVIKGIKEGGYIYPIWQAKYFEVVKRVETIKNEYLPKGVIKEIKTISWVRDEEFYK